MITEEMLEEYRANVACCPDGCDICDREARKYLTAALPILEKRIREDERAEIADLLATEALNTTFGPYSRRAGIFYSAQFVLEGK